MEKTGEKRKKRSTSRLKNTPILSPITLEDGACFIGWPEMNDLIQSVYRTAVTQILQGRLVFAFQPQIPECSLRQLIIVKNPERWEGDTTGKYTYSVSEITTGWSMYSSTYDYGMLETIIRADLEKYGVPKEIIDIYTQTIEKFKIIYKNEENNEQR